MDRPEQALSKIINGKSSITPKTAKELSAAFGISAEYYMNLQRTYDLAQADEPDPGIKRRARLQTPYPVREMIKRGWIEDSEPELLDLQMTRFFEAKSLDAVPHIAHAAKKTNYEAIEPNQLAWLFRVRQIAASMEVAKYSEPRFLSVIEKMRDLLAEPDEARHVPRLLAESGVRFVIVEGLPGIKTCGVTTWLNKSKPVIGMTLRYDRLDNFWFVLRHECEHILQKDGQETPVIDGDDTLDLDAEVSAQEKHANEQSLDWALSKDAFEDFLIRKYPVILKKDIVGFARRQGVHPNIVVGRVRRRLDRWNLHKDLDAKIRRHITKTAVVDGWGDIAAVEL